MGRSGDLLRQQKKQNARYVFTAEQLEAHDEQVRRAYTEYIWARVGDRAKEEDAKREAELTRKVNEFWDRRAREFRSGDIEDNFVNYFRYLLAMPCRILIEQFGWKWRTKKSKKLNVEKFADAMIEEVNRISGDVSQDIIVYAEQTADLYGISYEIREVKEHDNKGE